MTKKNQFEEIADVAAPALGKAGSDALAKAIDDLAKETDNEIGQQLLGWVEATVKLQGPGAVVGLKDWIVDMAKGDSVPPFPDPPPPLRVQSEMLAKLQNAEADAKSKFKDQMVLIGDALGSVLLGIVTGLIK